MLFPTFEFFIFFTLVLILNWFLKRWPLAWRLFLLFSSYYFYSVWDFRFLSVIFILSLLNFLSGLAIGKDFLKERKFIFILAVLFNIFALGYLKFYDFFRISAEALLSRLGFSTVLPLLGVILPIGLSFYILRAISYNIDVYLKKIPATSSFLDFAIYISFFPQLLAGPLMRSGDFLAQLKDGGVKRIENLYENFALIFLGLFKKIVISSYLTLSITDDVFAVPANHSSQVILLAVLAYALVIYCDFSGYSDMAIGFAGLMGFKSPLNFAAPYLSLNIQDFWRRWHISLSDWVRDYIYIPLGGNKKGAVRKYFNLVAVMVLVGFWHGATTNFIIWGGIQGLALVGFHFYQDIKKFGKSFHLNQTALRKIGEVANKLFWWFFTFSFVSFSWIFFRSENVKNALALIRGVFYSEKTAEPIRIYIIALVAVGFLFFLFERQIFRGLTIFQQRLPLFLLVFFAILGAILIFKLGPDTLPSFIYFNF